MRIQLIEDHSRLASHICKGLTAAGFTVDCFGQAEPALEKLSDAQYDAVILDLGLPDRDGLEVLRTIRYRGSAVPVIILTSRVQVADRVKGLNAGADDYLTKPFAMEELVARLNALLRRPADFLDSILTAGNLTFDSATREVRIEGTPVALSHRESALLEHLMRRSGKVVRKTQLEDDLYGASGDHAANSLEVLVHRLRRKLARLGASVGVQTIRGVGYLLAPAASPA